MGITVGDIVAGFFGLGNDTNIGKRLSQLADPAYDIKNISDVQRITIPNDAERTNVKSSGVPILSYPLNNKSIHRFGLQILNYRRPNPLKDRTVQIEADIFLPVPSNLTESYGVDLVTQDLGPIGSILSGVAAGVSQRSAGENLNPVAPFVSAAQSSLGGDDSISSAMYGGGAYAATQMLAAYADEKIGAGAGNLGEGAIESGFGIAPNPNAAVLFKNVKLRTHEFSWTLHPRNEAESITVQRIIGILRKAMLPTTLGVFSFQYPKVFKLEILPETQFQYRFKTCFLQSMQVNHAPTSPSFHRNGAPSEIKLSLTFSEIEYFTGDDFKTNGDFQGNGTVTREAGALYDELRSDGRSVRTQKQTDSLFIDFGT